MRRGTKRGKNRTLMNNRSGTCSAKIINRLIKLTYCKLLAESDLRAPLSAVLISLPACLPRLSYFKLQLFLSWMRIDTVKLQEP